jgi:endonuclease YncB( thermonuclease family)
MLFITIAIAACPPPPVKRETCVHDGDTIWIAGEKLRLKNIDTPELNGKCERERRLAVKARARVVEIMNHADPRIIYTGERDAFGRQLVEMPGLESALIAEGLAVRWRTRKDWCAA